MNILEELELRQVNTLDFPADKRKWPVTVTVQELDALIRVARAAHNVYVEFPGGEDQRRELKVLGEALKALHNFNAAEMAALQQKLGLHD